MSITRSALVGFKGIEILPYGTALPSGYSRIGYGSLIDVPNITALPAALGMGDSGAARPYPHFTMQLGSYIYAFPYNVSSVQGVKYDTTTGTTTRLAATPTTLSFMSCDGTNFFFGLHGGTSWYRYNVGADTWTSLTAPGTNFGALGTGDCIMCYSSGSFYVWPLADGGANTRRLGIYNVGGNSWTTNDLGTGGTNYLGRAGYIDSGTMYVSSGSILLSGPTLTTQALTYMAANQSAAPQGYKYGTTGYLLPTVVSNNTYFGVSLFPVGAFRSNAPGSWDIGIMFPSLNGISSVFITSAGFSSGSPAMGLVTKHGGWSNGDPIYLIGQANGAQFLATLNLYQIIRRT